MQQATRPARKIYVGNLPMGSSEGEITHFFNQIMPAAKATTPGTATAPNKLCIVKACCSALDCAHSCCQSQENGVQSKTWSAELCICDALFLIPDQWTAPAVQAHVACLAGAAGQPVVSCYIHHDKRFAFVEFRTVEEASNAIALDGAGYRNEILRVGLLAQSSSQGGYCANHYQASTCTLLALCRWHKSSLLTTILLFLQFKAVLLQSTASCIALHPGSC